MVPTNYLYDFLPESCLLENLSQYVNNVSIISYKQVVFAIAGMSNQLFVSTYMLQLPDKTSLEKFLLCQLKE